MDATVATVPLCYSLPAVLLTLGAEAWTPEFIGGLRCSGILQNAKW